MKNGQNFREMQQKKKELEDQEWVKAQDCIICNKRIGGAYANHGEAGWTCSATCMRQQDLKPRYPPPKGE